MEKTKIFISYSHADSIFADAVAKYLLRRNYDVWIDSRQLKTQCDWADDIDTAIRNADYVLGILSADAVRRYEVLRELCLALDENPTKLLPVMIGRIHDSWYANPRSDKVKKLKEHLKKYQNICFNGRGDITEERMHLISEFLASGPAKPQSEEKSQPEDEGEYYIAVNGIPEYVLDQPLNIPFYKVRSDDLSPVTGYPFALDNQWLPESVIQDRVKKWPAFLKDGFSADEVQKVLRKEQKENFLLALIHMKQLVINKSAILNSLALRDYYLNPEERDAFLSLLRNGSLVVFLYEHMDHSPYVYNMPKYETSLNAINEWNRVCMEVPIYCIRENWKNTIDQHNIDFVKFCCTIADNIEDNEILTKCFGIKKENVQKQQQFYRVLKDIAVQGFVRTRMSGTNIYTSIKGLSRSYFYSNFITREKQGEDDQPVLNCIFDKDKPFQLELKRMVDMFFNSLFTNCFHCFALLPSDMPPELVFLSKMYLESSQNTIAEAELKYAISEFINYENESIMNQIDSMGNEIFLDHWNLDIIQKLRKTMEWMDYTRTLEAIIKRAAVWQADFSEINNLIRQFVLAVSSVRKYIPAEHEASKPKPAYSFQISIGGDVIQLVVEKGKRKFKDYVGSYKGNQNPIQISFQIGDITSSSERSLIFYPVTLFDGMTDFTDGSQYHDQFIAFLKDNDFIEIEKHG